VQLQLQLDFQAFHVLPAPEPAEDSQQGRGHQQAAGPQQLQEEAGGFDTVAGIVARAGGDLKGVTCPCGGGTTTGRLGAGGGAPIALLTWFLNMFRTSWFPGTGRRRLI